MKQTSTIQSRSVAGEIRSLNPLLFQRFDDVQLDRLGLIVFHQAL